MAKPFVIELPKGPTIPILYEDRSVLAVDKPAGWLLAPESWQRTSRNLQTALVASIRAKEFWATSRQLKFLRFVHRLDAETTGVLLLAKSLGAVAAYTRLFEGREVEKRYLAVIKAKPARTEWVSRGRIGPEPAMQGKMRIDARFGKEGETTFRVLQANEKFTLLEARPRTGRTHQIRVHLASENMPVAGDEMYGGAKTSAGLGLRAVYLSYQDPFTRRRVEIKADSAEFLKRYGFELDRAS